MKILICDKCGHEWKYSKGITGSEFEKGGFETISPGYRPKGVVDMCAKCFKVFQRAIIESADEDRKNSGLKAVIAKFRPTL